ncbi:MAG TPA: GGDEF domain-containing protein [Marinobacter hydrocarbonoclasticus]|jgi:diguanylate cyclase (GGDEF)-like protein/PAS domain S-box-containing protein|uniref:GGDEF domain-containing protein n=2 Tax=Marinobacteraceae TaxID=2887365 RepID=A0A350RUV2_MARNT|nr:MULTISPECIES: EAL domain-containing protein [unclassified Marinobacter]HAC30068.1 GGDEF domain-containing protein [Marinobacter nauticus]MAC22184.1 GGDEF domain-containing protein [Marinobacter sp.]MAL33742.1 GGDEF domain-containing protein [Marinobacter sp.]HAX09570.1 GGDEF domain-containing protein [Marinobacter nauticus]HCL38775.1 GGDEF domain-containing protein [Marinobacter nauticus]|tara:strand:+ start:1292 stop:3022 length:1731 start_codon:yes stop_codon:yes gene_type:complete
MERNKDRSSLPSQSEQSEQKFHELIESLPMVAVQGYDRNRRVIYWNEASTRLYGYSRTEAQGELLEDLIIPEPMRAAVIEAHTNWLDHNISIPSEELELKHKAGHLVPVYSSHVMIKQDTGECEMFCIDISLEEQKQTREELVHRASFDDLTGLPNRRLMESELESRLAEAERQDREVAVIFLDLDNFKLINDTLGHHHGDTLLKSVADILKQELRHSDLLSRFGGDEFVLLLFDFDGPEGIHELLQRLIKALENKVQLQGDCYQVSASFGVSLYPHNGGTVAELMGNADAAMYRAKEIGKNTVCFYTSDINDRLVEYQQITALLRQALTNGGLELYYQPQIDLRTGGTTSCEALLRCFDKASNLVSPATFIPVAEKSGLINRIGDWVIDAACKQLKAWQGTELAGVRIDVNLSGRQLTNPHLADQILETIQHYGLKPEQLGVELTENEVFGSEESQTRQLERLKAAGLHISIDDFGTGYSSLVYLRKLPVCSIKIDRSFLHYAMENESDMSIMKAMVTVGQSLGLSILVEGVETEQQAKLIRDLGCDFAQGFLYAKPMPAKAAEAFMKLRTSRNL